MSDHPMDRILVRQVRFDFSELQTIDPVWSKSSPYFSMFINALGVHVPHFERYLVSVMREHRNELTDASLKQDVQAIIGQEAHHAFNFVNWTKVLCQQYPGMEAIDKHARRYFDRALSKGKKFKIGFTAGYETFTFLGGMIILSRYEELMGDADPTMRGLWVWHQVEEVEHGAVAFDFYKAFYAEDEWYRRAMVLFAFLHIAFETLKAYRCILNGEKLSFRDRLSAWRFFATFSWDLFRSALPVFRRDYHPRNHPICNDEQNPVAIAWRQLFDRGEDAHQLNDSLINDMLTP